MGGRSQLSPLCLHSTMIDILLKRKLLAIALLVLSVAILAIDVADLINEIRCPEQA